MLCPSAGNRRLLRQQEKAHCDDADRAQVRAGLVPLPANQGVGRHVPPSEGRRNGEAYEVYVRMVGAGRGRRGTI
eukprot:217132-Chlamydomonas_euryale.AAC.1